MASCTSGTCMRRSPTWARGTTCQAASGRCDGKGWAEGNGSGTEERVGRTCFVGGNGGICMLAGSTAVKGPLGRCPAGEGRRWHSGPAVNSRSAMESEIAKWRFGNGEWENATKLASGSLARNRRGCLAVFGVQARPQTWAAHCKLQGSVKRRR